MLEGQKELTGYVFDIPDLQGHTEEVRYNRIDRGKSFVMYFKDVALYKSF